MKKLTLKNIGLTVLVATLFLFLRNLSEAQNRSTSESDARTSVREKPVDQVFKNIKVLNGMPESQLYPAMRFMAASLGFQCGSCHVIKNGSGDFPADDKPEKQTARDMMRMVQYINKTYADGNPTVSCYTCHRGSRSPVTAPTLPLQLAAPIGVTPGAASALPSLDEVLNKYLEAIGGKAALNLIKTLVVKGTTTISGGQVVDYESEQSAPDEGHESFAIQKVDGRNCAGDSRCEYERVVSGRQGWLKSGAGVQELIGEQLADQKLSFHLFGILRLRDQYSSFRVFRRDKIDDRDVYVISAVRLDGKSERLYFDVESGLLRRRIGYTRTLIGTIPQQTDFEDYREVEGLKLPFTIKMAFADPGSLPITRKFTEIKLNVPVDDLKFEKP
jgi:Photosynthetic reaction centre cytochrome C subunit